MNIYNQVGEIMTSDLTTVTGDTPITELKNKFKRRSIHHILVENNIGELLGIISTEDFTRAAHFPIPDNKLLARHIMTASPVNVSDETPIKKVIDLFLENRFRAIPIVDKNEVLIGVVTPYDIMATLVESSKKESIDF